jgi:hypothetical protein
MSLNPASFVFDTNQIVGVHLPLDTKENENSKINKKGI